MTAKILSGKAVRDQILNDLMVMIKKLKRKPTLAIVLVGNDPASEVYVREKEKAAAGIGIDFQLIKKPSNVKQNELEEIIINLTRDKKVKGIVVQKPLPNQIDGEKIDRLVSPEKDIDGLNPASYFHSTTAQGVVRLIKENKIEIAGKDTVVVGRSKLSGLPTALLLLEEDATVTICHSKTRNLKEKTKQADILVSAAGVPNLIKADMVKKGAVVIDVGTMRTKEGKIVGDVDFENVKNVASYISPVPGGVGPMIVAGLMMNLVEASESIDKQVV
ncbi:MAG: tetrahydrofolate dehydrogenase/cyclohydrolase catalytic domain-containing protein [bacterium]|nr:tetrahydrofolate dehydrogenase/cyclohydrolase catalytic domain-containing protein [bacterium]